MEKALSAIIKGLMIGLCIGLIIGFVLSAVVDCSACTACVGGGCGALLGCDSASDGCSYYFASKDVQACYLFCSLICSIIGAVYGVMVVREDSRIEKEEKTIQASENIKRQNNDRANEVKRDSLQLQNICKTNKEQGKKPLITATYKSDAILTLIVSELATAAEIQGRIDALAKEAEKKLIIRSL